MRIVKDFSRGRRKRSGCFPYRVTVMRSISACEGMEKGTYDRCTLCITKGGKRGNGYRQNSEAELAAYERAPRRKSSQTRSGKVRLSAGGGGKGRLCTTSGGDEVDPDLKGLIAGG